MAYQRVNWKAGAAGGTPLSAENLNRMDQGIADAHAAIDAGLTQRVAKASGFLYLETANRDIPGCWITIPEAGSYLVLANVQVLVEGGDGVAYGRLLHNGQPVEGEWRFDPGQQQYGMATIAQVWVVRAAADDVIKLQARKSGGSDFSNVIPDGTHLTAVRIGP